MKSQLWNFKKKQTDWSNPEFNFYFVRLRNRTMIQAAWYEKARDLADAAHDAAVLFDKPVDVIDLNVAFRLHADFAPLPEVPPVLKLG